RHGAPWAPQRGGRDADGPARRQDRGRFRYRAATVHTDLRVAHQGLTMKAGAIRGGKAAQAAAAWRARVARLLRRIGAAIVLLLLAAGLALWWAARWTPDRALYPTQGVTIDAGNGD